MNNDLDQFENRSDDWLAKERKHEELVSAWDLDEAKKIKEYHEENCEAQEIKDNHHKVHVAYINNQTSEKQKELASKKISAIIFAILFILIVLTVIMTSTGNVEITYFVSMTIFICTVISLMFNKGRKK